MHNLRLRHPRPGAHPERSNRAITIKNRGLELGNTENKRLRNGHWRKFYMPRTRAQKTKAGRVAWIHQSNKVITLG